MHQQDILSHAHRPLVPPPGEAFGREEAGRGQQVDPSRRPLNPFKLTAAAICCYSQ